ncbi:phosphoribosyltransferase domain-containing protein [Terracoccus luteus]|uniref:Adenine/guanine phosphoribosyltransferase-like PRPP-binding protein n=1 Tax=Terracoccus luteus TaxID=53356 RepID=A0A839PY92_9MICO|nr:phosphoribosyltransferase domain-containing protein [Terracoccus luteus]MBB2988497.1 adenine/guanine phosphoribosyltransferase-like PRPP-binding protein [Terracoccus luteus]MCP2174156.1 adenine/guanine phosphoribosyltransferase-like PRPP-binding protein [Terracoccus luteus]
MTRHSPTSTGDEPGDGWTGRWVADALDVRLRTHASPIGVELHELVGLAVRRNPRRAHLLVSTVLGKHVPTDPDLVYGTGRLLGALTADTLAAPAPAPAPAGAGTGHAGTGALVRSALAGDRDASRALLTHVEEHAATVRSGRVPVPSGTVVLGYAETATALGHAVADALEAPYLHSTRRPVDGLTPVGGFEEEHSHATSHLLLPEDPDLFAGHGPLVLVDDELSTGTTALNTIAALHAVNPRPRYVIAALIDLRSECDRDRMRAFAEQIGARVDVVALAAGTVQLPGDVLTRGQALVAATDPDEHAAPERAASAGQPHPAHPAPDRAPDLGSGAASDLVRRVTRWTSAAKDGGRHGFHPRDRAALEAAAADVAAELATHLPARANVHVLGFEELMYAPLRLAQALAARAETSVVTYSTTTRSPVLALDDPGYAIRSRIAFPSHDDPADGPGPRFAYNVAAPSRQTEPAQDGPDDQDRWRGVSDRSSDVVVLVVDEPADTLELRQPDGLLAQLRRRAAHVLLVVIPVYQPHRPAEAAAAPEAGLAGTHGPAGAHRIGAGTTSLATDQRDEMTPALPTAQTRTEPTRPESTVPTPLTGPSFGSYAPDEVAWLLKDLSHAALEAPTEEREEAVQSGKAHYAESLPVEYQPSVEYQALFTSALERSAGKVAYAVGVVTEMVLASRGENAVLVSLARAGTPVGVLMRRWAQQMHGLELPHYAVSIVRGRGIDHAALAHIASRHNPADVMFVDGWTGKGAITRELAASVKDANATLGTGFSPEMAVLADTGSCVSIYGTREDYLIPSACLNSTVSGLVSRTVLNDELIGPGDFHGAKFYADLAGADVSNEFLDAVSSHFDAVAEQVRADVPVLAASDRTPRWTGWSTVERLSEEYGIHSVNLVKPGVGETTRVMLRRVPWKVLVRPDAVAELSHVLLLAQQRGVEVVEVPDLEYSCVGLIHPKFTRGATGADGTSAAAAVSAG